MRHARFWQGAASIVVAVAMLAAQATVVERFTFDNDGGLINSPFGTMEAKKDVPTEPGSVTDADIGGYRKRIKIVEPVRTLFGKSYNELAGAWWNWASAEPADSNVVLDPDGRFCDLNQEGKVWFLAGTFGGVFGEPLIAERTCQLPAGKAIFFPIFNTTTFEEVISTRGCLEEDLPKASLLDRLRCDVAFAIPQVLNAEINGEPVMDLNAYLAQSQPGGYAQIIIEDNIFALAPGKRSPAVANGFWVYLQPLPPGIHQISFSADLDDDGIRDLGANYELVIVDDDDDDDDDHED